MNREKRIFDTQSIVLCALFAALSTIGAYIKIPISYVPITMQLTFTTLAGMLLGPYKGALSISIYVIAGLIGLPVFTKGGGFGYILQPTFGYILGFVAGAFVAGLIVGKKREVSYSRYLLASFGSIAACYTLGTIYFHIIMNLYLGNNMGLWKILMLCVIPFIPGDVIMSLLASWVAKKIKYHLPL
jgi:biotin transport system substrate-specific component